MQLPHYLVSVLLVFKHQRLLKQPRPMQLIALFITLPRSILVSHTFMVPLVHGLLIAQASLVTFIKKAAKITLPRTAQAQYNAYKHVSASKVTKGDLVFFGYSKHSISHVGLYVGNGKMIDAQNRGVVTEKVHAPWWHVVGYAHVTDFSTTTTD